MRIRSAGVLVTIAVVATGGLVPSGSAAAAPLPAATAPSAVAASATVAKLLVRGAPSHVGDPVTFAFTGSVIDPRFKLARGVLYLGDKTSTAVTSLGQVKSHKYKTAGVYAVSLRLVDSSGKVSVKRRTVVVVGPDALRFRSSTRRLPASAVIAVRAIDSTHLRITLAKGTALPPVGATLVVSRGTLVPTGAAIVVTSRAWDPSGRVVLRGRTAALTDIYATLRSTAHTTMPAKVQLMRYAADGSVTAVSTVSSAAVPFTCRISSGNERPISVSADLSKTVIDPTIDIRSKVFQLSVISRPSFSLGVAFSGSAECSLGNGLGINIPVPAIPGLVVSVSPYFKLSATGTISAEVTYTPSLSMDVIRSPWRNDNFLSLVSRASASATGSASVTLEGGLSLTVSVATAAGIQVQLGPKIAVKASITSANGGQTCATATSSITAEVKLFAHVFFVGGDLILYRGEYFKSVLFDKCSAIGTSGGSSSGSGTSSSDGSPGSGGMSPAPPGPTSVSASNNNGQLAVQLVNFPVGTAYYFCHAGDAATYPSGGSITGRGQIVMTRFNATFTSGLCSGTGNTWIGFQAPDGRDYFSNQVGLLYVTPTATASNNNGQMALALQDFPLGATYYFCHTGSPSGFPTGGTVTKQGQFTVTASVSSFASGICSGSGNSWVGLQAADGRDYYSNQVVLQYTPPTATASNNNGQMAVQLGSFPQGTAYYFCHSGTPAQYPSGGVITKHGQVNVTSPGQAWNSGLCSGRGNAWIGLQAADGHDYFSNQVDLVAAQTPGAGVTVANNNGQMAVQLSGFPLGTTYYFCHSGTPSDYPTGGVVTGHGQLNVTSPSQSWASGLCSGRGNAWIGLQATDGADYYSNQIDLYAPPTAGADVHATASGGNLYVQFSQFPMGVTFFFCHSGDPSGYPTGGAVPTRGQITISSPNQSFGPLCSGSGNFWVGFQATDGHDYYTNQVTL